MPYDYMPSETFQRAGTDPLLSVRVDLQQVPSGASQRQILDAVSTFLKSLHHDDSAEAQVPDPALGFAHPYYLGGYTVGVVPATGRGRLALAGNHEGAQAVGSGRFGGLSHGQAGGRIVTSLVISSAGEDVLDSLEAGLEDLMDALGDLPVTLTLVELPVPRTS